MKSFVPQRYFDEEQELDSTPVQPEKIDISPEEENQLETLRQQNTELEARLVRLQADIANIQRNNIENSRKASLEGVRKLEEQLLPALDVLDIAMSTLPEDLAKHPWVDGIRQFEKLLYKPLADTGLQKMTIEEKVTPFDPQMHEAIGQADVEGVESGAVIQVYQQGYTLQDKVLRTAKVQVRA